MCPGSSNGWRRAGSLPRSSRIPHIWYGDLDTGDIEQVRAYNDFVADLARQHPGTFAGLATAVPWRGPEHLDEARRATEELGLAGFALPTSDQNRYLDSVPAGFWDYVSSVGAPLFVHPGGQTVGQDLMGIYRMGEVCGRPLDMTVTLARFILTGTYEQFPQLRLLCAHAGGAITTVADRLDFGHELRNYAPLGPWGEVELAEPPSSHVKKLFLDTVTFGSRDTADGLGDRRLGARLLRHRLPAGSVAGAATPGRRGRARPWTTSSGPTCSDATPSELFLARAAEPTGGGKDA